MQNMHAIVFTRDGEFIYTAFIYATSPEAALEKAEAEGLVPPMEYEVAIAVL